MLVWLFRQLELVDTVIVTAVETGRSELFPGFQRYVFLLFPPLLYCSMLSFVSWRFWDERFGCYMHKKYVDVHFSVISAHKDQEFSRNTVFFNSAPVFRVREILVRIRIRILLFRQWPSRHEVFLLINFEGAFRSFSKDKKFFLLFLLDEVRIHIRICSLTNGSGFAGRLKNVQISDLEHCSASFWKIFFETLCAADLFSESYFQLRVSGQLFLLLYSWISVDLLIKEQLR